MKPFLAFCRKEFLETLRTGRLTVLVILFTLFGIMNPAIAKLTPWMLETLSGTLAEGGIQITHIEVNALSSWTQFYKNIPMALIVFVLMVSTTFTAEYQRGTLIPVLTKGLSRGKVLAAKALSMALLWTACFTLCFAVTYGYTAVLWSDGSAGSLVFAALLYCLFGLWIVSVMVLFSSFVSGNTGVLMGAGGAAVLCTLLELLPGVSPFLPTYLTQSLPLMTGALPAADMALSAIVTVILIAGNVTGAALLFGKRSL